MAIVCLDTKLLRQIKRQKHKYDETQNEAKIKKKIGKEENQQVPLHRFLLKPDSRGYTKMSFVCCAAAAAAATTAQSMRLEFVVPSFFFCARVSFTLIVRMSPLLWD